MASTISGARPYLRPSARRRWRQLWLGESRGSVRPSERTHLLSTFVPLPPRLPNRSGLISANSGPDPTFFTNWRKPCSIRARCKGTARSELAFFKAPASGAKCTHQIRAAEHVSEPDRIAWKSMCATDEGKEKGEKWCKRAIWQNTLPTIKHAWKSVDKLTSGAFVEMWRERVDRLYARYSEAVPKEASR